MNGTAVWGSDLIARTAHATLALILGLLPVLIIGCVKNATLIEIPASEANRIPVSWAKNWKAEKFEEGRIHAELNTGEVLEGNYVGYRLEKGYDCTKLFSFENLGAQSLTNITVEFPLPSANGQIEMKGNRGSQLQCVYNSVLPNCNRVGLCRSDTKLYKIEF